MATKCHSNPCCRCGGKSAEWVTLARDNNPDKWQAWPLCADCADLMVQKIEAMLDVAIEKRRGLRVVK